MTRTGFRDKKVLFSKGNIENHFGKNLTQVEQRILNLVKKTGIYFSLPNNISIDIFNCYLTVSRYVKTNRNHLIFLAFSVYYISEKMMDINPITLPEICHLFTIFDHRITPRLILKNRLQYEKILAGKINIF